LYFAAEEAAARKYKEKLVERESKAPIRLGDRIYKKSGDTYAYNGKHVGLDKDYFLSSMYERRNRTDPLEYLMNERDGAKSRLDIYKRESDPFSVDVVARHQRILPTLDELIEEAQAGVEIPSPDELGDVYTVDIPDEDVMLHEDRRFSWQPEKVQKAIREIAALDYMDVLRDSIQDFEDSKGYALYDAIKVALVYQPYDEHMPEGANRGLGARTSRLLNEYGVKGIVYDGRQDGRGYVVFDDKAIRILQKASDVIRGEGQTRFRVEALETVERARAVVAMEPKRITPGSLSDIKGMTSLPYSTTFLCFTRRRYRRGRRTWFSERGISRTTTMWHITTM
jgi:hypothetical protein